MRALNTACGDPQPLVVGIRQEIVALTRADMILDHDCMQAVPFVVRPSEALAACEPRANPTRRPTPLRRPTRR